MDYVIEDNIIIFDKNFNKILSDNLLKIFKDVEEINFPEYFDKPIDNLPNNIKIIKFNYKNFYHFSWSYFNQKINNLPLNLKELYTGSCFNQEIDFLPALLVKLELGRDFNQPLINLPSSLKVLIIKNSSYKKQYLKQINENLNTLILQSDIFGFKNRADIILFFKNIYDKMKETNNKYIFEIYKFLPNTIKKLGIICNKETIIINFE